MVLWLTRVDQSESVAEPYCEVWCAGHNIKDFLAPMHGSASGMVGRNTAKASSIGDGVSSIVRQQSKNSHQAQKSCWISLIKQTTFCFFLFFFLFFLICLSFFQTMLTVFIVLFLFVCAHCPLRAGRRRQGDVVDDGIRERPGAVQQVPPF